jgi:hypothetical protein
MQVCNWRVGEESKALRLGTLGSELALTVPVESAIIFYTGYLRAPVYN